MLFVGLLMNEYIIVFTELAFSLRAPVVDVSKGVSTIPSQSWSMSSCGTFSSRTCSSVVSIPGWFSAVAPVRVCPLTSMRLSGSVFLVSSAVSGG